MTECYYIAIPQLFHRFSFLFPFLFLRWSCLPFPLFSVHPFLFALCSLPFSLARLPLLHLSCPLFPIASLSQSLFARGSLLFPPCSCSCSLSVSSSPFLLLPLSPALVLRSCFSLALFLLLPLLPDAFSRTVSSSRSLSSSPALSRSVTLSLPRPLLLLLILLLLLLLHNLRCTWSGGTTKYRGHYRGRFVCAMFCIFVPPAICVDQA